MKGLGSAQVHDLSRTNALSHSGAIEGECSCDLGRAVGGHARFDAVKTKQDNLLHGSAWLLLRVA